MASGLIRPPLPGAIAGMIIMESSVSAFPLKWRRPRRTLQVLFSIIS